MSSKAVLLNSRMWGITLQRFNRQTSRRPQVFVHNSQMNTVTTTTFHTYVWKNEQMMFYCESAHCHIYFTLNTHEIASPVNKIVGCDIPYREYWKMWNRCIKELNLLQTWLDSWLIKTLSHTSPLNMYLPDCTFPSGLFPLIFLSCLLKFYQLLFPKRKTHKNKETGLRHLQIKFPVQTSFSRITNVTCNVPASLFFLYQTICML